MKLKIAEPDLGIKKHVSVKSRKFLLNLSLILVFIGFSNQILVGRSENFPLKRLLKPIIGFVQEEMLLQFPRV